MSTTTTSAALVPTGPVFSEPERLALAGFLAGYSGLTRDAYALDLRQFARSCHRHHLALFAVRRAGIECFGRDLESAGRARATVIRQLCTDAGFYRYAVEEDLLDHSPAVHVCRPAWTMSPTPPAWTTPLTRIRCICTDQVWESYACRGRTKAFRSQAVAASIGAYWGEPAAAQGLRGAHGKRQQRSRPGCQR